MTTPLFELRGATALVTGASRGLGALLAPRLANAGMNLLLSARDGAKLAGVAAVCREHGVSVEVVSADVSTADGREALMAAAGTVDVLVNNAGVETPIAFVDQSSEAIEAQILTNLVAPMELTKRVLPGMIARGRGVIVNVSSMSGKAPTPYNAVYAATKHGLNGFTSSLRLELEGTGVHAGVVCPSFVADAGMWADSGGRAPAMMREVKPEKVLRAVFDVLGGAPEALVTPGPVRPLLALGQLFSRLDGGMLKRMGVLTALRARADLHKRALEAGSRAR